MKDAFLQKVETRRARVAVVGLGYVGLPLAVGFAEAGFAVSGIDINRQRVEALRRGRSYVSDVASSRLRALSRDGIDFFADYSVLEGCDAAIVCVPTPLGKTRDPDMSHLIASGEAIVPFLHRGMLVSLESTTYPGTTEELIRPILETSGLKAGGDFFLSFSPERIDPGRTDYTLANTPKVLGGLTAASLEVATALYSQIVGSVVQVSSTRAAEMVKLLENTFRAVNIALVNEIAIMCDKLDLDVWEVVEAAATKPYGFMKFTPGPGVGGHCIPLDPHYLSWKLRTLNYNARFIQLAGEINSAMPQYWVDQVQDALNEAGLALKSSSVLILGVAYKKDVADVRESPALDIFRLLQDKGANVRYHDPHVPELGDEGVIARSEQGLEKALAWADCVVVVTDHSCFDRELIRRGAKRLIDTRNAFRRAPAAEVAPD